MQAYYAISTRITSLYRFNLSLKSLVTWRDTLDEIEEKTMEKMTRYRWIAVMIAVVMLTDRPAQADDFVQVVMSSQDGSKSLSSENSLEFSKAQKTKEPVIEVDLSNKGQSILGLGASFDHSTCENLSRLSAEKREKVINRLMNPERGIGMNLLRLCIGASDFIGEPYYTYDDRPEGETDPELNKFSIEKDRAYLLPAIKIAQKKIPTCCSSVPRRAPRHG